MFTPVVLFATEDKTIKLAGQKEKNPSKSKIKSVLNIC